MNLLAIPALVFSLSSFIALVLLIAGWKRDLRKDVKYVLTGLLFTLLTQAIIRFLEWSGLPFEGLDPFSDFIGSLQPMLWVFLFYAYLQQVSDRRKDHLNSVLRSIRNVNQLLVSEKDTDALIEKVCDTLTETRNYNDVWIALLDESNQLLAAAESGLGEDFQPMLERLKNGDIPAKMRETIQTEGPIITDEPFVECKDCPLAESYGGMSSITARLNHAGNIYGIIAVSTPFKFADEEQEHHLFKEVAGDIALALHSIETEKELLKSEERYKKYFDKTGDAIFILKMGGEDHGKILNVNSAATEQTGYSRDGLIGMNMLEDLSLEPPPDFDLEEVDSKLSRGETVRFTEKKKRKDGTEYWTEVVVTPLKHENEQANLSINRDVTKRREAEEALKRSEKRYRAVFENTGTAMIIIEEDTTISLANRKTKELTGYSIEQIEDNMSWTDFVAEEEDLKRMKKYHRARREDSTAAPNQYEFKLADREGNEKDILISIDVIPGTRRSIASLIDITEQKKTERKLEHRAKFEELLREVSTDFLESGTDELEAAIDKGLARVGEFLEVDRSYVFTFDWDRETMSNTNEWCAEGIEPQIDDLQNLPISDFPAWVEQLKKLESIQIRSVSQLPESWKAEKENFEILGIESLVGVPISHGQDLIGFAGFDSVEKERDWKGEDIYLLRILGDLAGHAIYRRQAEEDIYKSRQELQQSFVQLAETTSRVLGVRDPYTQQHELRVAELAREVGKRMDLDEEKLLGLYIGGVLHDIGKIVVPETILTKPGELSDIEWGMIKSHPEVGYNQILKDTDFPWPVAEMTLHHHERLDGSGYPDGLKGDELTKEVRILGAVDVVEAMSTRRPYREARSKERTLEVIKDGKGDKFDPEVVDILVEMIEEGEITFG